MGQGRGRGGGGGGGGEWVGRFDLDCEITIRCEWMVWGEGDRNWCSYIKHTPSVKAGLIM